MAVSSDMHDYPYKFPPNLPSFLIHTYAMVDLPNTDSAISWNETGDKVVIRKKSIESILSQFFRHSRFESFVRQLKGYGFSRGRYHPDIVEFKHDHFRRGCLSELTNVKAAKQQEQEKRIGEMKSKVDIASSINSSIELANEEMLKIATQMFGKSDKLVRSIIRDVILPACFETGCCDPLQYSCGVANPLGVKEKDSTPDCAPACSCDCASEASLTTVSVESRGETGVTDTTIQKIIQGPVQKRTRRDTQTDVEQDCMDNANHVPVEDAPQKIRDKRVVRIVVDPETSFSNDTQPATAVDPHQPAEIRTPPAVEGVRTEKTFQESESDEIDSGCCSPDRTVCVVDFTCGSEMNEFGLPSDSSRMQLRDPSSISFVLDASFFAEPMFMQHQGS